MLALHQMMPREIPCAPQVVTLSSFPILHYRNFDNALPLFIHAQCHAALERLEFRLRTSSFK